MAAAPWAEGPHRVVVEFAKGSAGVGRRTIKLKHSSAALPLQLQGRIPLGVWQGFMADVEQLAASHPYVAPPSARRVCSWGGGMVVGAIAGLFCINPDGGDYEAWVPEAEAAVSRWCAAFEAGGARLSLQRLQGSYFIIADIDATTVVGQPAGPAAAAPAKK
ncbi:hypothetical protein Rsub_03433 [Raphidocelis subcapitata]|uniref:Uncharacterized protein n=1 Tax=Raphidocelis subcapitata TaxID=307507 RepID=A0A2V0NZU1_9CHLO|nr:hypothetical protein Rsub_03433 [Raphidocelis subcapitata]|eukprot:GBF90437.1 hypothetical protein Rsub_03433 [Raphidocelis subcapitata]